MTALKLRTAPKLRLTSQDPLGFDSKEINYFSSRRNNALKYNDPSGKVIGVDDAAYAIIGIAAVGVAVGATSAYINYQETKSASSARVAFYRGFASGALSASAAVLTAGAGSFVAVSAALGVDVAFNVLSSPPSEGSEFVSGVKAILGKGQKSKLCP